MSRKHKKVDTEDTVSKVKLYISAIVGVLMSLGVLEWNGSVDMLGDTPALVCPDKTTVGNVSLSIGGGK